VKSEEQVVHEDVTFLIVGDHVHSGELCHPVGKSKDTVTQHEFSFSDEKMYLVSLINCPHLIGQCYVGCKDLQLVSNKRK
jgi:hypothetical protein